MPRLEIFCCFCFHPGLACFGRIGANTWYYKSIKINGGDKQSFDDSRENEIIASREVCHVKVVLA